MEREREEPERGNARPTPLVLAEAPPRIIPPARVIVVSPNAAAGNSARGGVMTKGVCVRGIGMRRGHRSGEKPLDGSGLAVFSEIEK